MTIINKGLTKSFIIIVTLILAIFSIYYSKFTKFQGRLMYVLFVIDFIFIVSLLFSLKSKEVLKYRIPFSLSIIAIYIGNRVILSLFTIILSFFGNNIVPVGTVNTLTILETLAILFLFVAILSYPRFNKLSRILSIIIFLIITFQNFAVAFFNTMLVIADAPPDFSTIWPFVLFVLAQFKIVVISILSIICLRKITKIQQQELPYEGGHYFGKGLRLGIIFLIYIFLFGILAYQFMLLIKPYKIMVGNELVEVGNRVDNEVDNKINNKIDNYSNLIKSNRIKNHFKILDKYGPDYQIEYYETFDKVGEWKASGDVTFSGGKAIIKTKGNKETYLFRDIDLSNSKWDYLFAVLESNIESSDNESGQLVFYFDKKHAIYIRPNKVSEIKNVLDVIAGRDTNDFLLNSDGKKKATISLVLWGSDKLNFNTTAKIDELVIFSVRDPNF